MLKERVRSSAVVRGAARSPSGRLPMPGDQRRRRRRSPPNKNGNSSNRWAPSPRASASLPNPVVRPQARVRVQAGAGDKCVAPAKSKQKRRQAVPGTPVDRSTLSMDALAWSDTTYTIAQLIHAYGHKLPVIVKVVEGCTSNNGLDLSQNQVIQCHSFGRQQRVRATLGGSTGRVNLPTDYPIQVYYKEGNTEERGSLSELVGRLKPPFKVLVMSIDEDISVSTVDVIGRHLVITELYEEVFLRINTITGGWIDQEGIFAVPGSLQVVFSVAVGMRGATDAEWMDYYGMFARSIRHLNFNLLTGYDGIVIDDDGGGTIKLEKPTSPASASDVDGACQTVDQLASERRSQTLDPRPSTSRNGHLYENIAELRDQRPLANAQRTTSTNDERAPIVIQPSEGDGRRLAAGRSPPPLQTGFDPPPPGLPDLVSPPSGRAGGRPAGTPTSQAAADVDDDVEEMFQSVLDVAAEHETSEKRAESRRRADEQVALFAKRRKDEEERRRRLRLELQRKELERVRGARPGSASSSSNARKELPDAGADSAPPGDVGSVTVEVHREPSPPDQDKQRDVRALARRFESPHGSAADLNASSSAPSPISARIERRATPRAVVMPTVQSPLHVTSVAVVVGDGDGGSRAPSNGPPSAPADAERGPGPAAGRPPGGRAKRDDVGSGRRLTIASFDDVPKDVSALTADDVGRCLTLLNMERHLPEFQRRRVDGRALIGLKETVLINDYKFTPFNASKLMRFVRGWRPNVS